MRIFWAFLILVVSLGGGVGAQAEPKSENATVDIRWNVRIPLRDGVELAATAYLPKGAGPSPCVFTLTPYIAVTYHDRGMYFAEKGVPFLTVDVRGRGNSGGSFTPNLQEADDGYDVVEWMARQPWCNGKVSMWGGSYAGYNQWATASRNPPHLATIVPVASPYIGVDFPVNRGMIDPYARQWLALVAGRASQQNMFADAKLWSSIARERFERGGANAEIIDLFGVREPHIATWFAHRDDAAWWAQYNPSQDSLAQLAIPILTITGSYDADQPGALAHYRTHQANAAPDAASRHFLIIGPWDHAGTRTPQRTFSGLTVGAASMVDLPQLHVDWYLWTMADGPRPEFLKDRVAYYVTGAEEWRYAPSLSAVSGESRTLALASDGEARDVFASGRLGGTGRAASDRFTYDPRDTRSAELESSVNAYDAVDQRLVLANGGRQLVYTSAPIAEPTDIAGFFRLKAWITIDRPDTSLRANVYEILPDGTSVYLSSDRIRARYRESDFNPQPVQPGKALLYDFNRFSFNARRLAAGSRLRLVIDPMNSMYVEKNYNSGKRPELETIADAVPVNVTLHHDAKRPSALEVPIAASTKS